MSQFTMSEERRPVRKGVATENSLEKVGLSVALKVGRTLNESNLKHWSFRKE